MALWFDEGVNLQIPANLVRTGNYGLEIENGVYDNFSRVVTTGPTVLLPIALVFKAFGVGILQGRIVMAIFMVLALVVLYLTAKQLYGWKVAMLSGAFFLTGALADPLGRVGFPFEPVTHSRSVIGEVPGFFFIMAGVLLWGRALAVQRTRARHLLLFGAGLSWGFAIQSKLIYALIVAILIIWSIIDRQKIVAVLLPLAGVLIPAMIWLGYQVAVSGTDALGRAMLLGWPIVESSDAGILTDPLLVLSRLWSLTGMGFLVLGVPSFLFAAILTATETPSATRSVQGLLLTFVVIWVGWWTLSALGRPRHILPAVFVMSIFYARFLSFLGDDFALPHIRSSIRNLRSLFFWSTYSRSILVVIMTGLLLFNPTKRLFLSVARDVESSPYQVASYLAEMNASALQIAGSDRELEFLLGMPFYDIIWQGDQLPNHLDYIVCGPQAKQHVVCPPIAWKNRARLVLSTGPYGLYKTEPFR